MIDQLPPLGHAGEPVKLSTDRTQKAVSTASLSVVNVEAERARIRQDLTFRFKPLAGKGRERTLSVTKYGDRPYRQIVEELFLAFWATSAALHSDTARSNIYSLERFFAFLNDASSPLSAPYSPTTMRDLTFALMRDYERWLFDEPAISLSKRAERLDKLRARLATSPLPTLKIPQCPRKRWHGGEIVSLRVLERALGFPIAYVRKDPEFYDLIAAAAERQGLLMPRSRLVRWRRREAGGTKKLSRKYVEDHYYSLTKLVRYILKHRRQLLADDFLLAEFTSLDNERKVVTPSLPPAVHEILRKACLAATRAIKTRILVDGPARASRGRALPSNSESPGAWGNDLDNLLAYLLRFAPGEVVGQGSRRKHPVYLAGLRRGEIRRHPQDVATMLAPGSDDWAPFILLLGLSDDAPLNLEGLMTLHVDSENEREHCLRRSPTPGHKRLFFGKPRATIDQEFIDVPARSELDIPGLIETAIKLTATLRNHCRPEDKHALWLYLGKCGVKVLKPQDVTGGLLRRFVVKNEVRHDGELLLDLHFQRLRPTALSNVAFSHGIDEAQRRALHANPAQTYSYVNNPTNEPRLRNTVFSAQSKAIASVRAGFAARPPAHAIRKLAAELQIPDGAALEIILGKRDKLFNGCIEDTNGLGPMPQGQTCKEFESCLVCVNSVILERHLFRLIAYQRHWLLMATEMSAEAWEEEHALNCAIVDNHLTKFDPAVVASVRAAVEDQLPPIACRRFKQS